MELFELIQHLPSAGAGGVTVYLAMYFYFKKHADRVVNSEKDIDSLKMEMIELKKIVAETSTQLQLNTQADAHYKDVVVKMQNSIDKIESLLMRLITGDIKK